jgi:hypothetical protein
MNLGAKTALESIETALNGQQLLLRPRSGTAAEIHIPGTCALSAIGYA